MGLLDRFKNAINPDAAIRKQGRAKGPDGQDMVLDGPFPIANDDGRLNCKNCGVTFDSATVWMAQAFYLGERLGGPANKDAFYAIPCRKCSAYAVFLLSDLPKFMPGIRRRKWTSMEKHGINIMYDGPLPVSDSDDNIICRHCGLAFDDKAFALAKSGVHKDDWHTTEHYILKCSNCSQVCAYQTVELQSRPS